MLFEIWAPDSRIQLPLDNKINKYAKENSFQSVFVAILETFSSQLIAESSSMLYASTMAPWVNLISRRYWWSQIKFVGIPSCLDEERAEMATGFSGMNREDSKTYYSMLLFIYYYSWNWEWNWNCCYRHCPNTLAQVKLVCTYIQILWSLMINADFPFKFGLG